MHYPFSHDRSNFNCQLGCLGEYQFQNPEIAVSAYFFHLRTKLDYEQAPILVVDRNSEQILALNLPAFELLAINAVYLKFSDFVVNQAPYQQIVQHIQAGAAQGHLLLVNADGNYMECQVTGMIAPYYSNWIILRLNPSPPSPDHLHSSH